MNFDPPSIVNVAAYQFAELENLVVLRNELRDLAKENLLLGTILLSPEGINLFVAGGREGIDALLVRLRQIPALAPMKVKESFSRERPFNRMLVKIKREIIAFGVPGIAPGRYTSRRVSARELRRWLDEGQAVTLLDTRNNFEVQAGTFKNAVAIGVDDFRDFPAAAGRLPVELKSQRIVTFCTGGIRCEKATPLLEREGFTDVFQLDGGILKYLEECGAAHYEGHCFVFDKRVAVDATLKECELRQCFACQAILSLEEQASADYAEGKSCPRCFRSEGQARVELIAQRHLAIRRETTPLPGSVPYENVRPISVPLRLDGGEVLDMLDAMHTHLSRAQWRQACEEGSVICRGEVVRPGRMMRSGERLLHTLPAAAEPDVSANIEILYEDAAIVVVNKPAPLPMHPCGRFNRNTLSYILDRVYQPTHLRPAHRLDADTTGVVVLSKTREVARLVQPQFEAGSVKKMYLARVHGRPAKMVFECHVPIHADPGVKGIRLTAEDGTPASTRFRVMQEFDDGSTLLEVEPLTGRTNQIRAHLWNLGLPIVGDPAYLTSARLGGLQSLSMTDPPLCLHAAAIEFSHPITKARVRYEAPNPGWTRADSGGFPA